MTAEQKAPQPAEHHLVLKVGGVKLVMRRPTEAEVITILDKREAALTPGQEPGDAMDDGSQEIYGLVLEPNNEVLAELRAEFADLGRSLFQRMQDFCGDVALTEDGTLCKAKRTIGLRASAPRRKMPAQVKLDLLGLTVVLKKIGELDLKFLQRDAAAARRLTFAQLSSAAKERIVHVNGIDNPDQQELAKVWAKWPFLTCRLGERLFAATQAAVEEYEGK